MALVPTLPLLFASLSLLSAPLVRNGVIVVTINYRLGLLGFFAHRAIDAEGHRNGNYGFMDQQLALKWVRFPFSLVGSWLH